MSNIEAGYCSDIGDRKNNEDRAGVFAHGRVFCVADGMGGHVGGERASALALDTVGTSLDGLIVGCADTHRMQFAELFCRINAGLMQQVRDDPAVFGLGTTLTLGVVHQHTLSFAHIGDSRLYLWRDDVLTQLTDDHTHGQELVELGLLSAAAAQRSRQRHVLTRFLGTTNTVEPQIGETPLRPGDRLLLCSDGLYDGLAHDWLTQAMSGELSSQQLADGLVQACRAQGRRPLDNITALVIRVPR